MVVYCVSVQVLPGRDEDFRNATKINSRKTLAEKGNIRFDVLQSEDDECSFLLYEVYRSDDAVAVHKATKHYREWKETVAPWMARDRQGVKYRPVTPGLDEQ